jgi:4'-phosphopantetheinyl transferase
MPEPSAPDSYSLRPGDVHIWKAPLASTHAALGDLPAILSAGERERAARFAFEKDQARFIACRATLRLLLSRYTGDLPDKILFRYEPHGKPALGGAPGLQFNLSHSRDFAAIAISRSNAVGIDIEFIDPDFRCREVAPEFLSTEELRVLAARSPAAQPNFFFQIWTIKEALLKAVGGGFSLDPRLIRIRMEPDPEIVSAPPCFLPAKLDSFTLEPGYASALAVLARESSLSFFTF